MLGSCHVHFVVSNFVTHIAWSHDKLLYIYIYIYIFLNLPYLAKCSVWRNVAFLKRCRFKVAVLVTDSDSLDMYRYCIGQYAR